MLSGNESNTPEDYGLIYTNMLENPFHKDFQDSGPRICDDYLTRLRGFGVNFAIMIDL